MMYQFCTLFDRNYLFKGLALHDSLMRHAGKFCLHILCMDGITYEVLAELQLSNVRLIKLTDFEDEELLRAKATRTVEEYCWTCTPSLPLYVLKNNPAIDLITYLDADLFFFHDPYPIFDEFGDNSILIVEHRHAKRFEYLLVNGIYNVEWLSFRRDQFGISCLEWWRERCNEWCYRRLENGKLGDQKYLDDWPRRFPGVHVLQHVGSGVAPWNFFRYEIAMKNGRIMIDDLPLVFYHFHGFKWLEGNRYYYMAPMYTEEKPVPKLIYVPYIAALASARERVRHVKPDFNFGIAEADFYWRSVCQGLARKVVPPIIKAIVQKALIRARSVRAKAVN